MLITFVTLILSITSNRGNRWVMKRYWGFLLSELMTAAIVVVVSVAVGFGLYVSGQRDSMVEQAEESLAAIKAQLTTAAENGTPLTCDNASVGASVLTNDYLTLTLKPILVTTANLEKGYAPAVVVESTKETDSGDTFDTAKRLYDSLEKAEEYTLRVRQKVDDEIAFSILVTDDPVCAGNEDLPESNSLA